MDNSEEKVKEEIQEEQKASEEKVQDQNKEKEVKDDKKKNKKGKKALIVILIVLILGIAGAGSYLFIFKDKEKKTTKIKTDQKEVYSDYRMSGNSLEKFDLAFLKLENDEKNKVYSPLSIKYALAMLSEGSKGETKKQIDTIIGDYKSTKYNNNEHMSFANAMFIRNTYKEYVNSNYTNNLKDKYNAEVIYDGFESPNNINSWVSDKTFNLINNLVDSVDDNNFFLINALAIDMNWNNQIHCEGSHKIPCVNNGIYHISYAHEILDEDSKMPYGVTDYPYSTEEEFYSHYSNGKEIKNKFNGKEGIKGATVLADFNKYDIVNALGESKIKDTLRPEYEAWLKTDDGKDDLPVEEGLDRFINELKSNYGKNANSTDFLVHEDDNIKVFAKDLQEYDSTTLQYVGIMPKNEKLTE